MRSVSHFRTYLFTKFKPTTILALSFLSLIIFGTFLLMLPISNIGNTFSLVDHLFTATSATCVTGLVTYVVSDTYTLFGKFVILFLIQVGGLGLMTFISILLLFMKNKLEFKEKLLLKDSLNKIDISDIASYIKGIIGFTFGFEAVGAIILFIAFKDDFSTYEAILHSIFVSISAFCNAGIDCFGNSSLMIYQNDPLVLFTVAVLIIFGGIGFMVWFDFKAQIGLLFKANASLRKFHNKLKIHTHIVVFVTLALLLSGTVIIFISEYNGALADLNFFDKLSNSFFQSATLRTAGFYSIDLSTINRFTKLIMIIFMIIGGSPGGIAGGIKTTTFFVLTLIVIATIRKENEMIFRKRHITKDSFYNAFSIVWFYFMVITIAMLILFTCENFASLDLLYEVASAIATVGLSVGITPALSTLGKIVIIVVMFLGRVGPITLAYSLSKKRRKSSLIKYPDSEIMVG